MDTLDGLKTNTVQVTLAKLVHTASEIEPKKKQQG